MSGLATLCVLEKPECGADYFQSISRIQYVELRQDKTEFGNWCEFSVSHTISKKKYSGV